MGLQICANNMVSGVTFSLALSREALTWTFYLAIPMTFTGNGEEDENPERKHRRAAQGSDTEETGNQNPAGRRDVQAEAASKGAEGAGRAERMPGWAEGMLWTICDCLNMCLCGR